MARDYTKNRRDNRQYQQGAINASAPGSRHSNRYNKNSEYEDKKQTAGGRTSTKAGQARAKSAGRGFQSQGKPQGKGDRDNGKSFDKRTDRGFDKSFDRGADRGFDKSFDRGFDKTFSAEPPEGVLIGRNPVMEALKSGREITKLMIADGAEGSIKKIAGMARDAGIIVQYADRAALDRAAGGGVHQGVVAHVSDFEYCEPEDILRAAEEKGEQPFIIILDGIEDPHNLGAIIRTADAAGAHGVIIPKRRAAQVNATAEKSAAGAASYVPVARVNNISQTIDLLKERGVWIAATDMEGTELYTAGLDGPIAIVIGNEGSGISRLVKEKCDLCVTIPMLGGVNSLNASNAAAILMYEVVRRRR